MNRPVFNANNPPATLCLVRLSAIGDVTHIFPIINTIRSYWPQTKITWIIGKSELELVRDLPGIEFVAFDKSRGIRAYFDLRRQLGNRRFDVLLLMQLSLRSNLIPLFINVAIKIGFDRQRSKGLHSLFINHRIEAKKNQHVLDSFFCFTQALGIKEKRLIWNLCYSDEEQTFAENVLPTTTDGTRTLLISPCSSHVHKNWLPERYAEIANYAIKNHMMRVVLTGGNSPIERDYSHQIATRMTVAPINLIGKTTLRQLMAVIAGVDIVISPDSGPAHLATCAGKPVIGLFATTNPDRSTPYLSRQWCVNCYPHASRLYLGKDSQAIPWGTKIKNPQAMSLITVADVCEKLDALAI